MPEITRRRALLSGAALAFAPAWVAGCTTRHRPRVPTPRENLLDETLALEESLLASYDAAISTLGPRHALTGTLLHIRDEHAAHRSALLTSGAQSTLGPSATPTPPAVVPRETPRSLAAAETAAATIRTNTCLRAPRDLAPLLASLAASETSHAALLREAR